METPQRKIVAGSRAAAVASISYRNILREIDHDRRIKKKAYKV